MTELDGIYRAYFNDVFLFIRKLSNDEHIADEVTSETFFRAMRAINSFRGECDIRVWLCQIAKRCYYTYIKQADRASGARALPETQDAPEDRLIRRDEAARIRAALRHISGTYREVFTWRVFAELSFKQIGQIYGKSENWACVTYHRAVSAIKTKMEDDSSEK